MYVLVCMYLKYNSRYVCTACIYSYIPGYVCMYVLNCLKLVSLLNTTHFYIYISAINTLEKDIRNVYHHTENQSDPL